MTSTTTGKFVIEASEFDGTRQIVPKEIPVDEGADSFQASNQNRYGAQVLIKVVNETDVAMDGTPVYIVANNSDGANDLTVRDSDTNTVVTVSQNEAALVLNTGSGWVALLGAAATGQNV